jgi:GAF domain-containing protein/HAMP domain-containing protein
LGGLFAVLISLLLIAVANYTFATRLNQALVMVEEETARSNAAIGVGRAAADLLTAIARGALTQDSDYFVQTVAEAGQALSDADERLTQSVVSLPSDDPLQVQLARVRSGVRSISRLAELLSQQAGEEDWQGIERSAQSLLPSYGQLVIDSVEQMQATTAERRAAAIAQVDAARRNVQVLPMMVVVLVVGTAMGAIFVIIRSFTRPIERLTEVAIRLAAGQMGERFQAEPGDRFGQLAGAFNEMADQMQANYEQLEQRVAERMRDLQAATEVSRVITSVLDPDELLNRVVNLARERFSLYYVGLFLVDQERKFAVLHAGTGKAGREMLEQGHKLGIGSRSMIGQCVARSEPRIALDVGEEAVRFVNPHLPDTRSELALPLRARGQIIGAMTVQSVEEAAFDETNIAVLQTMADQVAVALDNARLFSETQSALEEMEDIQRRYLGQAWTDYLRATQATHYETRHPSLPPLGDATLRQIRQAVAQKSAVALQSDPDASASPHSALVAPIALRGAVVGALGIHDDDERRQWTDEEIATLNAVAERMALAADNLRLLDATQRRAAHEQLVGQIASRVRSSLDPDTILKTTVRELGRALGARAATVDITAPIGEIPVQREEE